MTDLYPAPHRVRRTLLLAALGTASCVVMAAPLAAQLSPSVARTLATCEASAGPAPTSSAATDYPGGLATRMGALTPATAPGAVTVSPTVAACLQQTLGGRLLVIAAMSDSVSLPNAHRFASLGEGGSLDDLAQDRVVKGMDFATKGDLAQPVLVYCHHLSCYLSYNAVLRLHAAGYTNVFWMRAGIRGWKEAGFALGTPRELDGMTSQREFAIRTDLPSVKPDNDYPIPPMERVPGGADSIVMRRLCHAIGDQIKSAEEAPTTYQFEEILRQAAGLTPSDRPYAAAQKIQTLWKRWFPTGLAGPSCGGGSQYGPPPHFSVRNNFREFVSTAVDEWMLPMNLVEGATGMTVLDVLAAEAVRSATNRSGTYSMLRRVGAKHRSEMEADGSWPSAAQLQAQFVPLWRAQAEHGDVQSMLHLASVYARGEHITQDLAIGRAWGARAERRALEIGDWETVVRTGVMYRDTGNPVFPNDAAHGVALFKRASDAGYSDGQFWMARAYGDGNGIVKNEDEALRLFKAMAARGKFFNGGIAGMFAALILESRGKYEEGARYLRWFGDLAPLPDGRSNIDYFKQHKIDFCGLDADGKTTTGCQQTGNPFGKPE